MCHGFTTTGIKSPVVSDRDAKQIQYKQMPKSVDEQLAVLLAWFLEKSLKLSAFSFHKYKVKVKAHFIVLVYALHGVVSDMYQTPISFYCLAYKILIISSRFVTSFFPTVFFFTIILKRNFPQYFIVFLSASFYSWVSW